MIAELLFSIFSFFLVVCAFGVVLARTPFNSVLFLIVSFFNASGLFLLRGAEFLAMVLVIVYIGAVAVLFLFVVMMLNADEKSPHSYYKKQPRGVLFIACLFALEMVLICLFCKKQLVSVPSAIATGSALTNTELIGQVLYTDYFYPFQISGFILLVAMIGAIVLSFSPINRGLNRRQQVSKQLQRRPSETLVLEKVNPGEGLR